MRISKRRLLAAACTLSAVALAAPVAASASAPSPSAPAAHIGGIVPVHGQSKPSGSASSGSNLSYHNGPVMQSNNVYVIYWVPSGATVSSSYESIINQYFTDVATDNGKKSNVYATDTQYYDLTNGNIAYNEAFKASAVDLTPYPANGCTDTATSICLSDSQIQSEIRAVMTAHGWTAGPYNFFVMLTAKGVGSCSGSSCAFTQYCAYHGASGSGSNTLYYANMPYAGTNLSACGSQEYPNGDSAADSEINVLSHEHNETITDKSLNAWYDRRGYENGDKCAWNFGTILGGNAGAEWNQVIGGHDYYLQQEWSNANSGCVLHM